MEKLTRRQEGSSWEVCPNRILESCSKKELQCKCIVRTLVNQWGWPLALRCLSQFTDQKMIENLINRTKGNFVRYHAHTLHYFLFFYLYRPFTGDISGYLLIPLPNKLILLLIRDILQLVSYISYQNVGSISLNEWLFSPLCSLFWVSTCKRIQHSSPGYFVHLSMVKQMSVQCSLFGF